MLRDQRRQPLHRQPGPGALHQVLENPVGEHQAQQQGHQASCPRLPGLFEAEQKDGQGNPHQSAVTQMGVERKQGCQDGVAHRLLEPEQDASVQIQKPFGHIVSSI